MKNNFLIAVLSLNIAFFTACAGSGGDSGTEPTTDQSTSQNGGGDDGTTTGDGTDTTDCTTSSFYRDADGDGFGISTDSVEACTEPAGYVSNATDCNDASAAAYTGATEGCDGIDNDCDGTIDEGVTTTYYSDADGDGYGTASSPQVACSAPAGYVDNSNDCNDASALAYTGAVEFCDGVDNDCNGSIDDLGGTINVPEECGTIQGAIDLAANGSTILVGPGTYYECIETSSTSQITIQSTAGAEQTIITDALAACGDVAVISGNTTLDGFSLTGTSSDRGALISDTSRIRNSLVYGKFNGIHMRGNTTASNVKAYNNNSSGITVGSGGNCLLENINISNNGNYLADFDRGLDLRGASVIARNVIISGQIGIGIYVSRRTSLVGQNMIIANSRRSGISIGGIQIFGDAMLTNSAVINNEADDGAAFSIEANGSLTLINVDVSYNSNNSFSDGAVSCYQSTDCTFNSYYSNYYENYPEHFYNITSPLGSNGNLNEVPQYIDLLPIDAIDWDLTLQPTSGLINAGDPAILDADGSRSDIGAFGGPGGDDWEIWP